MSVTLQASNTLTTVVGTSPQTLTSIAVAGVFQLIVDLNAMADGDVIELRASQIVLTGAVARVVYMTARFGLQPVDDKIAVSVPIVNDLTDAGSVVFTLTQTFGSSRSIPWKVVKAG